jgi:nucleotide-binding universal stress UspA family protein
VRDSAERRHGIFGRIVVGTDGSAEATLALHLARRLRAQDGRLLALSVAELHHASRSGMEAGQWVRRLRAAAQDIRRSAALELAGDDGSTTRMVDGRADAQLLQAVRATGADLLGVGSTGSSRAAGFVFGRVATAVVHQAPCSILVARGDPSPARFPERIVVGTDGSSAAADAESVAQALADAHGASLRRLMATGGKEITERTTVMAELDPCGPVDALVDAARGSDLLIVGSRGLHGFKSLGSVAERVAHRAFCPVLIVRTSAALPSR